MAWDPVAETWTEVGYLKKGRFYQAITIVAIGTSLPDLFASMKAATDGRYADSAVGNVTGSNSVNVFLGLGLPWVIAVIYANSTDTVYKMPATGLTLSVIM